MGNSKFDDFRDLEVWQRCMDIRRFGVRNKPKPFDH
jgi:hypothetical protein